MASEARPKPKTEELDPEPKTTRAMSRPHQALKRGLDLGGSLLGLCILSPVMVTAAAGIALTMGRPILFRQERGGLNGEVFSLFKFRTMRIPRPGEDAIATDDERITSIGRILRSTSVDELPSLLNVLTGDMSLVGPRPLLARYLPRYSKEQARRHEVKPGLTGWAQINGRNAIPWAEKFELDCWYVDHQSLGLDFEILKQTVSRVLGQSDIDHSEGGPMPEFLGTEDGNVASGE